ncbi:MAG TPA: hypothetical protein VF079_10245 [Sphingomicrobium sp.]
MSEPDEVRGARLSPTMAALIAGAALILLALAWYLGGNRNPDQDKLSNPQVEQETGEADQSKRCSANATYDLIKRALFGQAARQRGSDQETYKQIAGAAVLRVDNPVLENVDSASGALNCSGTFYLDLPPGVVAGGGQHSLMADLDYTLRPGEAGDTVALRNAEGMISALATLTRVSEPLAPDANAIPPEENVAAARSATVVPGPAIPAPGRPSFDCARAGTRGEIAVCGDSGLAALDVNMTSQYRRALAAASPEQRQLLQTTRDRFLAYRDRCPNRTCMADAYVGRMREIRDIMEGRLTPAR